jgi:hypothetical protein
MTKSDKLPTIGQAAESYGLTKEAFQKRISTRCQIRQVFRNQTGIAESHPDTPTGMKDAVHP